MDLIYTNANKEDQGVLFDYEFDLAFGEDENDFSCTVALENHCIEPGAFLYIEGTEYGGIVDSIKVDTEQKTVTYLGRTWHGILEGAVICPFKGTIETQIQKEVEVDKSILPQGYQEVEYIQSSGTQRIDTGFMPNNNSRVVIEADVLSSNSGNDHHIASVFSNSHYWTMRLKADRSGYAARYDGRPLTNVAHNGNVFARHVFDQNKNVVQIDTATKSTFDTAVWSATANLPIFCYSGNGTSFTGYISMKLYSCKIYDNGVLVRNFTPCKNPSGTVGLYDLVSASFYGNNGTGVFVSGPDVIRKETVTITETIVQHVNEDHHFMNGEGNAVLAKLIEYLGLTDIFKASTADSGIRVINYPFRYVDAYSGICKMLAAFDGKLKMKHVLDKVVLYTEPFIDFSQDEEFDSSQVDFTVQKNFRPLNHLICLGQGNLKDRYVIHLFTDEGGGVQPYTNKENPVEDADYILDTSKKLLTGINEVADVLDMPNTQTTENFIKLSFQPLDWAENYANYFIMNEDGDYVGVNGIPDVAVIPLTSQPEDWAENYAGYFHYVGGELRSVEAVTKEQHIPIYKKPATWEKNFGNYYEYWSDGVDEGYKKVNGKSETEYILQTVRPSDWKENYSKYYERLFVSDTGTGYFPARPKVGQDGHTLFPPGWRKRKYYTAKNYQTAPEWDDKKDYFILLKNTSTPVFLAGNYYMKKDVLLTPSFLPDVTFKKVFDHYKVLVESGLERLKKSMNSDKIDIDLDLEGAYDIGDIVGASEHVTGMEAWQPITKKIVTIKDGHITISYKVGD